ncbi:MAG: 2-octaprenyl-3-methyl-6-methoxy-1,4-benzoquinol hydroxylase [Gammaproteobacteria bacterium]
MSAHLRKKASAERDLHFDLVVVGAGMVGAALACSLRDAPLRIAIIEGTPPTLPAEGQIDLRVSAISRASEHLLEETGVWEALQSFATPYLHMRVWDSGGHGSTTFSADELGEPNLGHIVENRRIQTALWERLASQDNTERFCPALLKRLEPGEGEITIGLDDGRRLTARLVVGADGGRSRVRELTGIRTIGRSYGQKTIVGNVHTSRHHQYTAWQRFLPTGPVAFLPLHDGGCSIAWHTQSDEADRLMALDEKPFCEELTRATGQVLGVVESIGPRGCFPLHRQHAESYHRGRVVLVGDAAHTIHPLAGQGVNLGFLDALALGEELRQLAADGRDMADAAALTRYERRRRPHNLAIMGLMDLFADVFASERAPLRWARNLGLNVADHAGPIKQRVIRYAMGLDTIP